MKSKSFFFFFTFLFLLASPPLWGQAVEGEQNNVLLYGISTSTEYDDRLESAVNGSSGGEFVYSFQPHVGIRLTRPRWQTTLDYLPSFTYSPQGGSRYDSIAHSVKFLVTRQISKRLSFGVESTFTLTNNPFDALRVSSEGSQSDVLDDSNRTLSGQTLSRRAGLVRTEFVYALSKHSSMGVGGSFKRSDYRENADFSFDDTRRSVSESGHLFYTRRLGPRASTGFRYTFQKIDFGRGQFKTDSHSLLYLWNMDFTPKLSLSAFAGPDYSESRNFTVEALLSGATRSRKLSAVGGATLGWSSQHYGLSANAVRRISDGGGAQGNVLLDSFSLYANRQISRRSSINGFVTYDRNQLLMAVAGSPGAFDYLSGGAGFERTLTQNCSLTFFYWRIYRSDGQSDGLLSGNRAGIRLAYNRQRPLGR